MSDTDHEIPPALSEDQWELEQEVISSHASGKLGWFILASRTEQGALELQIHGDFKTWIVDNPHALAALCLIGQSFGFTHEDVANLRAMPDGTGYASVDDPAWFASLIARIAALLPPAPQ